MNKRLFFCAYNTARQNKAVGKVAVFLASHTNKIYAIVYCIGVLYAFFQSSNLFFRFIFVPFICMVYNTVLRKILNRPRPFNELNIESLIEHDDKGSCPSNHSAGAMVISVAWYSISPIIGVGLTVLAVLTGVSRVMTGVHYPLDVALGWAVGLCAGVLGFVIF